MGLYFRERVQGIIISNLEGNLEKICRETGKEGGGQEKSGSQNREASYQIGKGFGQSSQQASREDRKEEYRQEEVVRAVGLS